MPAKIVNESNFLLTRSAEGDDCLGVIRNGDPIELYRYVALRREWAGGSERRMVRGDHVDVHSGLSVPRGEVGASLKAFFGLVFDGGSAKLEPMWSQPYLETCCRAALHRVHLCGQLGRPAGLADDPCLHRLEAMGLCCQRVDGHFVITGPGQRRHAADVLGVPSNGRRR